MTKDVRTHSTNVELVEPVPPELAVGSDLVVQVKVACPEGCDLSGMPVTVAGPDGPATIEPRAGDAPADASLRDIMLKAPLQVGEHVLSLRFAAHQSEGILHQECTLPIRLRIKPH